MFLDYYNLLDLPFDATQDEIRAAYFDAARKYHPDVNSSDDAASKFIEIQKAYEILSSPQKRSSYDFSLPEEEKQKPHLNLNVLFSRESVQKVDGSQLLYVLLECSCTQTIDISQSAPTHFCLVLDRSTSMQGERLDILRSIIGHLSRNFQSNQTLSIVAFSDRAEVVLQPTSKIDPNRVESVLHQIQAGGATEILQGLQMGVDVLRQYRREAGHKHLILITDGHTYGDEQGCVELAGQASQEGIQIHALGIGDEWNDRFLDQLATLGGGSAELVRGAEDLFRFAQKKILAENSIFARKVVLDLQLGNKIELIDSFKIYPDQTPTGVNFPIHLGVIPFGKKISIILELKIEQVPEDLKELNIFRGNLWFEVPTRLVQKQRLLISFNRPILSSSTEKPPTAILQALSALTMYRLQEKARKEVQEGNIEKATRYLQNLGTNLISHGDRALAREVLLEADHIQKTQHYSQDGEKRIKYGTRSLLLLPSPE